MFLWQCFSTLGLHILVDNLLEHPNTRQGGCVYQRRHKIVQSKVTNTVLWHHSKNPGGTHALKESIKNKRIRSQRINIIHISSLIKILVLFGTLILRLYSH